MTWADKFSAKGWSMSRRLQDACAGVFVDKVLMERCKAGQRKRQAVGVSALTTSTFGGRQFRLVIRAKYVVSSAGTLHTPALLLRSKITCRGNVGKNLRLHPATAVTGVFGEVSLSACVSCCCLY